MTTLMGVNVPYFYGDYGHDLAPNPRFPEWPHRFEPMSAYGPVIEAKQLGFGAVRTWLCENAEGIVVDGQGRVTGVHPDLLDAVEVLQEAARMHGLVLYFCLLDGNAWAREGDHVTRSILADADQAARFAEHVVGPLARVVDQEAVLGLDVVNEPESSTRECIEDPKIEPVPWESIGTAIRLAKHAALAERDLVVTSGTMHVFLPRLLRAGAELTAVDVHVYHPNGGLPSRDDLVAYVGGKELLPDHMPLIGGELGIPKDVEGADERALVNYVHNAERLGYRAAFLWKLDGLLVDRAKKRSSWTSLGEQIHDLLAVPR